MNIPPPPPEPTPAAPAVIAPAAAETPAVWPAWVAPVDLALGIMVVALAFLVASHVARNSDVWLHLAAGRDLLSGAYSLGSDPYSYAAADRTWVNHAWLYDLGTYLVFRADPTGATLVAVKAALFAAAIGLLFFLRRSGQSLWPWVVCAAVGVLAAAPHAGLRPLVVSALFLALTLVVLFRLNWKPRSWRYPVLLAVLGWFWASMDAWFLLGPAVVLITLLGEMAQAKFLAGKTDDYPAPRVADLAKAFGLVVLGCSITPHHVGVWQLPAELGYGLPSAISTDSSFASLVLSPLSRQGYMDRAEFGANANGIAFGVLLLGSGLLLAVGVGRVRLSQLFLWILFAYLALQQHRLILFFVIVAVPLSAMALCELAGRVTLGRAKDQATRLKVLASSIGRLLALPTLLLLLAAAYPGWLHPKPADPSLANRVAWGVVPDAGFMRMAKQLQSWRDRGRLPAETRGLSTSVELANHCAWFAPAVKVFMNARYRHHAAELGTMIAARQALRPPQEKNAPRDIAALSEALAKAQATYLIYASNNAVPTSVELTAVYELTDPVAGFALWHLDGRCAILGRPGIMAFDPVALAFDAATEPLPEPVLTPAPPRDPEFVEAFMTAPKVVPVETLDALVYHDYAATLWQRTVAESRQRWVVGSFAVTGVAGVAPYLFQNAIPLPPPPDALVALNLLTVRAARRATALNPDHPDAYLALAFCYDSGKPFLPGIDNGERQLQQIAALRRFLDRMPSPEKLPNEQSLIITSRAAHLLARAYDETQQHDLSREATRLACDCEKRHTLAYMEPSRRKAALDEIDKELAGSSAAFQRFNDPFVLTEGAPASKRVESALANGLPGEAIKLLNGVDYMKEFGADGPKFALLMVQLKLMAGRLEEAAADIDGLEAQFKTLAAGKKDDAAGQRLDHLTARLGELQFEMWQTSGNYAKAGAAVEAAVAGRSMPPEFLPMIAGATASLPAWTAITGGGMHAAVGGGLTGFWGVVFANNQLLGRPPYIAYWQTSQKFFLDRGLMLLIEGKTAGAKQRFRQSLAPHDVPVPAFLNGRAEAERYLRLFDRAEAAAK